MKSPDITLELFMEPGRIVRMGVPPVRIEILNRIDGVNFTDCLSRSVTAEFDYIRVPPLSGYMSCRNLKMRLMSENLFLS